MNLKTLPGRLFAASIAILTVWAAQPATAQAQGGVIVTNDDITDRPYKVLGEVSVIVPKAGLVDPKIDEKVDAALRAKAAAMRADAIVLVRTQSTGMDINVFNRDMGHVEATGRAVTFRNVQAGAAAGGGQTPSQAQMKATLHNYVDLFNAGKADAVIALYADDATIEDPIGSPLKTGRAGVEGFVRGVITRGVKYELISPIGSSNIDVAEMAIRAHSGATLLNVIELYTFDGTGKITSMKAYWGSEDREKAQ